MFMHNESLCLYICMWEILVLWHVSRWDKTLWKLEDGEIALIDNTAQIDMVWLNQCIVSETIALVGGSFCVSGVVRDAMWNDIALAHGTISLIKEMCVLCDIVVHIWQHRFYYIGRQSLRPHTISLLDL